ncbi:CHAT domain-containing protein [Streptomyces sp. NPDC004327]|uniref:CHAT domain-containing protein n=1 Tax=Streptomyces sp. NPDC004327 TaxID=3364699 RepID=UPI0036B07320
MGTRDEAADRARDLVRRSEGAQVMPDPQAAAKGPSAAERDVLIEELRDLLPRLEDVPPGDGVLPAEARARLGALLGARWTETRDEADRQEATGLLRRAREGELLDAGARTDAARDLLILLVGGYGERRPLGPEAVQSILNASVPEQHGGPGLIESAPEIERLAHEIAAARRGGMPAAMAEFLAFQTDLQAALAAGDGAGLLGLMDRMDTLDQAMLGPMAPMVRMLRRMLPESVEEIPTADVRPPTPEEQQELRPLLGLMAAALQPEALSQEQLTELLREADEPRPQTGLEISDGMRAMARALLGARSGDPDQHQEALRLLGRAAREQGQDEDFGWFVRGVLPGVLAGSSLTSGSRLDFAVAEQLLRESLAPEAGPMVAQPPPGRPGADDLLRWNRQMLLMTRVSQAADAEDTDALEALIGDVLDLLDEVEGGDGEDGDGSGPAGARAAERFMPLFLLGYAHLGLAKAASDAAALRSAAHHLEQAYADSHAFPFARVLMDALWAPLLALTSYLDPEPERVAAAVVRARASLQGNQVVADQRIRTRMGIAMALTLQHRTLQERATPDPGLLDEALAELETARGELTAGTAPVAGPLLWDLAEGYATRAGRGGGPDLARAVAEARASLRATAADVLLQEGVQHGLETARGGARRGLLAAAWAVRAGRPEQAVACLEAGRALVLAAAAVSATVPERLAALGEEQLARQWREARPGAAGTAAEAGTAGLLTSVLDGSPGGPDLPSGLRRRVLELLRGQGDGRDGEGPGVAELRGEVGRSGADALVYLLPGEADDEGWALFLVPDRAPWALPLPALSGRGRAPVAAYLAAGEVRSTARRGHERWEAALDVLCDWAGDGVMGPVLGELGLWERGLGEAGLLDGPASAAPVRLVLVPCGNLGVVPWQAARLTVPDEWRAAGAPAAVRACEPVVLTYAASGREFLRAARTRRLPVDRGQALVCVPGELETAEDEVLAVHDAYYPDAALYGEFDTLTFDAPPPRGTPAEVLGLLGAREAGAEPVAVVHLVCHGTAGAEPGASVLELGPPDGADDEAGLLSVTRLLDTPAGPAGAGRPLVVLSACETDLSTRDHDEALTVTTAFVHGLAADAVGSRWKVADDASAVLMTVFHHHVAAGLAPPDALRAAQRWMLAPAGQRPAVRGLTPHLLRIAARSELTGPAFWGAFIHQGNPAPRGEAPQEGDPTA